MARARGPTGTVRGIPAQLATQVLTELLVMLQEHGGEERVFVRHQASQLLEEHWQLDGRHLEGMLLALERMPGIRKLGGGVYQMPAEPELWVKNRMWRYGVGRVNLADAVVLYELLRASAEQADNPLTPTLMRLGRNLGRGIAALGFELLPWPEPREDG